MFRVWVAAAHCLLLAACATLPTNPLALNQIASYRLESVAVSVAPDAQIWWGEAEREFAAKHGETVVTELRATKAGAEAVSSDANNAIVSSPQAQKYLRDEASRRLQAALMGYLGAELHGNEPVRLEVTIHGITVPSAAQRVVIGGVPVLEATATLIDARTGKTILTYPKLVVAAAAGNGVAGVLIDQLLSDDHYDSLIKNYATAYREWLLKT